MWATVALAGGRLALGLEEEVLGAEKVPRGATFDSLIPKEEARKAAKSLCGGVAPDVASGYSNLSAGVRGVVALAWASSPSCHAVEDRRG